MAPLHEFIPFIKSFGLTEYESRIMLVLFKERGITAKELSAFTQIPITKIYQVLKVLEKKEFIKCTGSEPKKYHGITARKLFERIVKSKEKSFKNTLISIERFLEGVVDLELERAVFLKQIHPCLDARRV